MSENILSVRDLSVHYVKEKNVVKARTCGRDGGREDNDGPGDYEPCSESARPDCRR